MRGLLGAAAGLGSRCGWWDFRIGFSLLRYAVYGGLASAAVSLAAGFWAYLAGERGGLYRGLFVAVLGLGVVVWPCRWMRIAHRVPSIHDITTDLDNPPAFVAVVPLRRGALNPVEYGGPDVARQQKAAYPDLAPAILPMEPPLAFKRALAAAKAMGWVIDDAEPSQGRIEATATTFWFGFKDDVVVRIVPDPGGSRIDVRSVSRVGRGDVGTNAERIRKFLKELTGMAR